MKIKKLTTTFISIFLYSCLTFSSYANVVAKDSIVTDTLTNRPKMDTTALVQNSTTISSMPTQQELDEITTPMMTALDKDVALTDVQKVLLKKKTEEYAANLLKARTMSNKAESYTFMEIATNNYQAALEGFLTSDQKVQKEKKKKDRIDALVSKSKK